MRLNSILGHSRSDHNCMKSIFCALFLVSFVGCSRSDGSSQSGSTPPFPENVALALANFNAYAEELNNSYREGDGHSLHLAGEVVQTDRGYKFVVNTDIETSPSSGGGVQVKEEHLRKTDAWSYSNIFLLGFFYEEVDLPEEKWMDLIHRSDTFYEITYRFNVNGILVDATAELPFSNKLSSISLHDPFDSNIYHWPYVDGQPAAGPDHWCFKLDCNDCNDASSLMGVGVFNANTKASD